MARFYRDRASQQLGRGSATSWLRRPDCSSELWHGTAVYLPPGYGRAQMPAAGVLARPSILR